MTIGIRHAESDLVVLERIRKERPSPEVIVTDNDSEFASVIDGWRREYNLICPYSSLAGSTPGGLRIS